jgi:hypothetical protein
VSGTFSELWLPIFSPIHEKVPDTFSTLTEYSPSVSVDSVANDLFTREISLK